MKPTKGRFLSHLVDLAIDKLPEGMNYTDEDIEYDDFDDIPDDKEMTSDKK